MPYCRVALLALLALSGACRTDSAKPPATVPETPSAGDQRTRDSILGASSLPGAGAIRGALRARDTLEARGSRIQSP